jgi:hypothetical protein
MQKNDIYTSKTILESLPRGLFFTYPQLGTYNSDTPKDKILNPHELIVKNPKHNNSEFNKYLDKNLLREGRYTLSQSIYGVGTSYNQSAHSNFWLYSQHCDSWFENHYLVFDELRFLKCIPGVKNVYFTGSNVLLISNKQSDIDLIIETSPNFTWLVRFWVKLLLKIQGKDVYRFWFQTQKILNRIGFNFDVSKNTLEYKKRPGIKVDCGLITSNFFEFKEKYIPNEQYTITLRASKILGLNGENTLNKYIPFNFWKSFILICFKTVLYILSFFIYPIITFFAYLYIVIHKNQSQFIVNWNNICFYPLEPIVHQKIVK